MAQGPMSSILVTIRITIRMNPGSGRSRSPKSEIRIHWILAFGGGLRSLSTSSYQVFTNVAVLKKMRGRVGVSGVRQNLA